MPLSTMYRAKVLRVVSQMHVCIRIYPYLAIFLQGVAELQQQVAELKLERSQLLKAVTESQHDAACLAEHVRQIGQLKQVLASVQQDNAELSKGTKV